MYSRKAKNKVEGKERTGRYNGLLKIKGWKRGRVLKINKVDKGLKRERNQWVEETIGKALRYPPRGGQTKSEKSLDQRRESLQGTRNLRSFETEINDWWFGTSSTSADLRERKKNDRAGFKRQSWVRENFLWVER